MSLLNEALRKNKREIKKKEGITIFPKAFPDIKNILIKRKRNNYLYCIGGAILVLGFAGLFFIAINQPQEKTGNGNPDNSKTGSGINKIPDLSPSLYKKEEASPDNMLNNPEPIPLIEQKKQADTGKEVKIAVKTEHIEPETGISNNNAENVQKYQKKDPDSEITKVYFEKALRYHRENRYDDAILMYREVLKKDKDNFEALFNLASVFIRLSSFKDAYPVLTRLMDKSPDDPNISLNLAVAEIGLQKYDEALSHLKKAEEQGGLLFDIYLHRGIVSGKISGQDDAIRWYREAEKIDPYNKSLLFNLAMAYDNSGSYLQAIRYYESYLKVCGDVSSPEQESIGLRIKKIKAFLAQKSE